MPVNSLSSEYLRKLLLSLEIHGFLWNNLLGNCHYLFVSGSILFNLGFLLGFQLYLFLKYKLKNRTHIDNNFYQINGFRLCISFFLDIAWYSSAEIWLQWFDLYLDFGIKLHLRLYDFTSCFLKYSSASQKFSYLLSIRKSSIEVTILNCFLFMNICMFRYKMLLCLYIIWKTLILK